MNNDPSIIYRILKFLVDIHPFGHFSTDHMESIAKKVLVSVHSPQEVIFKSGQKPNVFFYIVKKGAVEILDDQDIGRVLVDKCGEGDMFGIRPILAESEYLSDAICTEHTILYEIPIDAFREIYHQYPAAVDYMIQRFAAGWSIRDTRESKELEEPILLKNLTVIPTYNHNLVSISLDSSIKKAILKMSEQAVSSIVICDENKFPKGIITDRDIRNFVATGYDPEKSVEDIMSSPVHCISPSMGLPEIQLVMIESGLHHLCVTEDGTDKTRGISMVTEHDVLYANATDPVVILKKIKGAKEIDDLKRARNKIDQLIPKFLEDQIEPRIILQLINRLNRALIGKTVDLMLKRFNSNHTPISPDSFCFYSMGSAARGEQLLMTDQDNGMILHNQMKSRKADFLLFSKSIVESLKEIGYKYCPGNMMVSNPDWCQTYDEMVTTVDKWILNPGPDEVLHTSIFFDFNTDYGDRVLEEQLKEHIQSRISDQSLYIRFLANHAVAHPPPLSFFRKFIIEKDGQHKNQFDIKMRGISPLSNCARVLSLARGYMTSSNTYERFEYLKTVDEGNYFLYEEAQESFYLFLQLKLKFALINHDSGRYIDPDHLNKMDRIELRKAFAPARRLIDMIERNYQLTYL